MLTELFAVSNCPPVASCDRLGIVEITRPINMMVMAHRHRAERLNRLPRYQRIHRVAGYISLSITLNGTRESVSLRISAITTNIS